jgi:predicted dehydrogenase
MSKITAYRAALVGLGDIAWRFGNDSDDQVGALSHWRAYQLQSKTTVVAGCSPEHHERCRFRVSSSTHVYESLASMLKKESPDVVSICSPSDYHATQAIMCIEAGVPMVWLEKPPARDVEELDSLITAVGNHNERTTVLVNYQRRYMEGYSNLREWYHDRTYGVCLCIDIIYSRGLKLNGVHMLDCLNFVLGDVASYRVEWVSDAGESPDVVLTTTDGLRVMITGVNLAYHCIDISLTFERARASVVHGGIGSRLEEKVEHELYPGFHRLKDVAVREDSTDMRLAMERALEDLITSHIEKRSPLSSLATARRTQQLLADVREWPAS